MSWRRWTCGDRHGCVGDDRASGAPDSTRQTSQATWTTCNSTTDAFSSPRADNNLFCRHLHAAWPPRARGGDLGVPRSPRAELGEAKGRDITGGRSLRGFIRGRERRFGDVGWNQWPEDFAQRKHDALAALLTEQGRELAVEQAVQFFFDEQWRTLRAYCAERGIRILGDVAIFVNYDSAEVWRHPELFELDEKGGMVRVSGVPPDYYSATGQRWGNPLYRWEVLKKRGFDWWVARVRRSLALYDMIRLDHFRGFEAYWSIAAQEKTAAKGQWVKAPGLELFERLKEVFGELPFIAEDLGLITPEVVECGSGLGFRGCGCCSSVFRAAARTSTCRTNMCRIRLPIRGRTTTTPRWDGGRTGRRRRSANT